MGANRNYDPSKIVCTIHNTTFVCVSRDEGGYGGRSDSYGCPECVAAIRSKVHFEINRFRRKEVRPWR